MDKLNVVTHDGKFHSDEVFAMAVLALVYGFDNLDIIRTRDHGVCEQASICIDVGRVYDPEKGRFDHHQGLDKYHTNGHPYASFGMVWERYAERIVSDKSIADYFDNAFVSIIDAFDNGINVSGHSLMGVVQTISDFNPPWNVVTPVLEDTAFMEAVKLAMRIIENRLASIDAGIAGKQIVAQGEIKCDGKVMVLPTYAPWITEVTRNDAYNDLEFVIFPARYGDQYMIQAVPMNVEARINRTDFPEEWCGLIDADLAAVSGINDAVFCHRGGFIAGARTLDGALKMACNAM